MAKSNDYYTTLGVERTASEDDIRRAYRKLARQYHPDVNKDPEASKRFSEVTEAYDVLSDAEKRKEYDRFGRTGVGAGHAPGGGPGGFGGRTTWTNVGGGPGAASEVDFSEVFEQMFGGGAGSPFGTARGPAESGFGSRARQAQPRKGEDIHHTLAVTFITAALGGAEQLRLGQGAGDGKSETIDVKIPAGIESGAKLRIKGRGHSGREGGQRGDLLLTVHVGQHPHFRRQGLDLLIDVPITIAEAALGVTVTVPLLKGTVQIKIAPGTSSGRKLRVPGKGIVNAKGEKGDFYAVVQIHAPEQLSEQGQRLLEELSKELKNPRESGPMADSS